MSKVENEAAEEKNLIERIRKGDVKAKEEFVKRNQGLVIYIAKKYAFSSDILQDLVAEGNMGLLRALEKYDFRKKVKFGTYAYFWIKRFVLRAVIREFEIFRIPERVQEFREKLARVKKNYQLEFGRLPTDVEISKEIKVSLEVIKKLKKYSKQVRVVSSGYYDGEKETDLFEVLDFEKNKESSVWEILMNKDILEEIFSRLRKKEKRANVDMWLEILKLHFGIEDGIQRSYKEIAVKFGVSRQRIHQIIKICLEKLQDEWKEMQNESSDGSLSCGREC